MIRPRCQVDHVEVKRDEIGWRQLEYVGVQIVDEDESGPAERIEIRNCTCGTTLGRTESLS